MKQLQEPKYATLRTSAPRPMQRARRRRRRRANAVAQKRKPIHPTRQPATEQQPHEPHSRKQRHELRQSLQRRPRLPRAGVRAQRRARPPVLVQQRHNKGTANQKRSQYSSTSHSKAAEPMLQQTALNGELPSGSHHLHNNSTQDTTRGHATKPRAACFA
jgi:hypothetical protein